MSQCVGGAQNSVDLSPELTDDNGRLTDRRGRV